MSSCQKRIYGTEFTEIEIESAVREGRLLSMEMEFNSNCNFSCVYCYASNNSACEGELNVDELRDLIRQANELGAKKIIILGGEPMLYPHLFEMIGFIKDLEMEVEIFTNGANITLTAAKKLYEYGAVVVLKMNSFDDRVQDLLSGKKGAAVQIRQAFRNLKKAGYPSGCSMGISTVICRQNIDELEKMWQWLRDQGIDPYFEMITPQGKAKDSCFLEVDNHRLQELFHNIAEIDRSKYGYDWVPQPPLVGGQCLRHQFSCSVNSFGDVQPCVGVTIPVGNIRERKLHDIIRESEVINDLRNYKRTIKGPCGQCVRLNDCYGCRGAAYQCTGDYMASDPLCWNNADKQAEIVCLPAAADGLVPHKPPMLLIDRVTEVAERRCVAEVNITAETIFVGEDGRLDEASYPEIISQAIAADKGFKTRGSSNVRTEGFLLGIKNLEVLGDARVGDKLRVSVFKAAQYGDFGIIHGEVFKGEEIIARGEVKIWHKNNNDEN
jgi:MoaA/NifB/PqqE/SkfB family radical SAM enzyme/predicted hotdog family 3-hydroxylacyl-ACP dehydratase